MGLRRIGRLCKATKSGEAITDFIGKESLGSSAREEGLFLLAKEAQQN